MDTITQQLACVQLNDNAILLDSFCKVLAEQHDYDELHVFDPCFLRHTLRFLREICWDPSNPMYADTDETFKQTLVALHGMAQHIETTRSQFVVDYLRFFQGIHRLLG